MASEWKTRHNKVSNTEYISVKGIMSMGTECPGNKAEELLFVVLWASSYRLSSMDRHQRPVDTGRHLA